MFVGHALFAFALVAGAAGATGRPRRRALAMGALAGAFAAVPDVDILYAFLGPLRAEATGAMAMANAFWETGNAIHRAVTHSLVLAVPAALAAAAWADSVRCGGRRTPGLRGSRRALGLRGSRRALAARGVSVAVAAGMVGVVTIESGALGGLIVAAFGVSVVAIGNEAARRTDFSARAVFGTALLGLWSHPFGDLFTGHPPAFLYPFDYALVTSRIALHPDPTVNLLAAFGLELFVVWVAVAVFVAFSDVRPAVARHATVGVGYAAAVLVIPAPTLDLSYPFVFSVLAIGFVGVLPSVRLERGDDADARIAPDVELPERTTALLTGLTAVTLAWLAYVAVYAATGGV